MSKTKKITLDSGKQIEVKKLPLGRYAELLAAIRELPKKIGGLENLANDQIMQRLPSILSEAWPEAVEILSLATEVTVEELNQIGLDEAVELALAVYEVNDYRGIYEKIKKATARPAQMVEN